MKRYQLFLGGSLGQFMLHGYWHIVGKVAPQSLPAFCADALLDVFFTPGCALMLLVDLLRLNLAQYRPWAFWAVCFLFWLLPVKRLLRLFGAHDPYADKDKPRPALQRGAVFLLDEMDKRLFGRQKSGGWA